MLKLLLASCLEIRKILHYQRKEIRQPSIFALFRNHLCVTAVVDLRVWKVERIVYFTPWTKKYEKLAFSKFSKSCNTIVALGLCVADLGIGRI